VTMVLLNVDLMCAMPRLTLRRVFFFLLLATSLPQGKRHRPTSREAGPDGMTRHGRICYSVVNKPMDGYPWAF
jgi:hypothetical protein